MSRIILVVDDLPYEFKNVESWAFVDGRLDSMSISVDKLKSGIERELGVPFTNQRLKVNGKEIHGEQSLIPYSKDIIIHVHHTESDMSPYHLSKKWLRQKWPHMSDDTLQRFMLEFNDVSKGVVCRSPVDLTETIDNDVAIQADRVKSDVLLILMNRETGQIQSLQPQLCIPYGGYKLFLNRLLPDGSGVELLGERVWRYKRSTPDLVREARDAANRKREEAIAQCQKLLRELPIALENCERALAEVDPNQDGHDYNQLGVMVVEEKRIKFEIIRQEKRLAALQADAVVFLKPETFPVFTHQSVLRLKFGLNQISPGLMSNDDVLVLVTRIDRTHIERPIVANQLIIK